MKRVITVDFDDTLATTEGTGWGGSALIPIQRIIDYIKKEHKKGAEIHIVTFRNLQNKPEVEKFVKQYSLPISGIHCTEGKTKTSVMKKLKSELHIDDDIETLVLAELAGIKTLLVDWDQEEINSTAQFFKKI